MSAKDLAGKVVEVMQFGDVLVAVVGFVGDKVDDLFTELVLDVGVGDQDKDGPCQ